MRGPWLAVLAVAVLVFLWLQREPAVERSPAIGRDSGPQEAPPEPVAGPSAPVGDPRRGRRCPVPSPLPRPGSWLLRAVSEDKGKPVHTEPRGKQRRTVRHACRTWSY